VTGTANPAQGGAVTGGGTFFAGSNIQLTATASNGWIFMGWSDGTKNNPYSITVPTTNTFYTATFMQISGVGGMVANYSLNGVSYRAHIFTNCGTFVLPVGTLACDVLVVGGGGAGGGYGGGGGGGGGVIYSTTNITSGSINVVVGNGGTTANGANSGFGSLTAIGGGNGASGGNYKALTASSGGCGGGGGSTTPAQYTLPGAGTAGQGYAGGTSPGPGGNFTSAGGGGAGAPGVSPATTTSPGGNGGVGASNLISGSLAYYGGGGGGSTGDNSGGNTSGTGGAGGGGNGAWGHYDGVIINRNATAGAANTGGGGGGGGISGNSRAQMAGGSGIVIVRYVYVSSIVTVAANPPQGGVVTGGGAYLAGTNIQLSATANNDWTFTGWSDGTTNNPFSITVPATSVVYTASFAPILSDTTVTGGTITNYTVNGVSYRAHIFTNSGTFSPSFGGNFEYLVVAGGGSGGTGYAGGGGGAGGCSTGTLVLASGAYSVTVGAGGGFLSNGLNSSFASITSLGGGCGQGGNVGGPIVPAGNGGSGGGGGWDSTPPFTVVGYGTPGQGNNGGTGYWYAIQYVLGGGGGGAGQVGGNAALDGSQAGNGGNGILSSLSGIATWYGGGGGGAAQNQPQFPGTGGLGGGGTGSANPVGAQAGASNTGGGGGGTVGLGGSGIVIIRYQMPVYLFTTNNGTITITGCTLGLGDEVTIPDTINGLPVTSIGNNVFYGRTNLTSVTIGSGVTNIGDSAFYYCTNLRNIYFRGSAPNIGSWVFGSGDNAIIYYLPGTTNWASFSGPTPVLWNPQTMMDANFGVRSNGFGFTITGTPNISCVVEVCTNLASPVWTPLATNTLASGSSYFSDSQSSNRPAGFYRFRAP
jgi:hypothetical protein